MATIIQFDAGPSMQSCTARTSDLRRAVQDLRGELGAAAQAAAHTANTARGLQNAFTGAAKPLTESLNPALQALQDTTGQLGATSKATASGLAGVSRAASTAARTTAKAVRGLAAFDEIQRLPAAAASGSSGGSGGSSKKSGGKDTEQDKAKQPLALLEQLRRAVAAFWEDIKQLYAPAIAAWQAAWAQIQQAALSVWDKLYMAFVRLWEYGLKPLAQYLAGTFLPGVVNSFSQAFAPIVGGVLSTALALAANGVIRLADIARQAVNTVIRPALELVLQVWQGVMQAVQAAWATYGRPVLDGLEQAVRGLGQLVTQVWSGLVQPVLQNLIEQASLLWDQSLQPLFNDLGMALGAVASMLLQVWNEVLMPLLNWAVSAFMPAIASLCQTIGAAVMGVAGVVAGAADAVLLALRGVADFVSNALRGQWDDAWNGMAATISAVWSRITSTVGDAVNTLKGLVQGLADAITAAIQGAASLSDGLGGGYSGYKVGRSSYAVSPYGVAPSLGGAALTVPALARGAVIPPNREFLAVLGDQRSGTNIEAPLSTIQEAVAAVMQDVQDGELAALQQVTDTLRQILEAVYGIRVGDEVIGRAAQRYQLRQTVITGGY